MSWQSTIMPDDAPELAGSLVGTMLHVGETGEITGDGTGEALPDMDGPLWKVMEQAGSNEPGTPLDATAHALEVRDLLTEQAQIARGEQ
jgi:hypothetical protein